MADEICECCQAPKDACTCKNDCKCKETGCAPVAEEEGAEAAPEAPATPEEPAA